MLVLDAWAITGIYNDDVLWFRYLNYFGYYVPFVAIGLLLVVSTACHSARQPRLIFLGVFLSALPATVLPWVIIGINPYQAATPSTSDSQTTETRAEYSFVTFSKMSSNRNFESISELLNCETHTVIAMQETAGLHQYLKDNPKATTCRYIFPETGSYALFSRYPIHHTQQFYFGGEFVVDLPDISISVFTFRLEKSLSHESYQHKNNQITIITNALKETNRPTLIAGDFNATPHNATLWKFKTVAHYAVPEGMLNQTFTFPANGRRSSIFGPLLRIDHIFYRDMEINDTHVMKSAYGSDHYPVVTHFKILMQPSKAPIQTGTYKND